MNDLFDQFRDKLVRITYEGAALQPCVGVLRRSIDGFWHLVRHELMTNDGNPTSQMAVRETSIMLIEELEPHVLQQLAQRMREAQTPSKIMPVGVTPQA